jgi:dihydroorotase
MIFRNLKICDTASPHNGQTADLVIDKGVIVQIAKGVAAGANDTDIDCSGLVASIGWLDFGTQICDPGLEQREDIASACRAAAAGGFTAIAPYPNTQPAIHSKSEVLYLLRQTHDAPVEIFPLGSVSLGCAGKDLAELYDMHQAGALAFTDGAKPIQHPGLMLRALEYVKAIDGLIANRPHLYELAPEGQMHEGLTSTSLGLRGLPSLAETLMAQRDIYLAAYSNSRLHIADVSAKETLSLIREAKSQGLKVTASVPMMNLIFEDTALEAFDTNYKLMPPLRGSDDRHALLNALADGTLDFISTGHTPWDEESKNLEFPYAEFGSLGLQTLFPLYATHLADVLPLEKFVELVAVGPRRVLGLPVPSVEVGQRANLAIFSMDAGWTFAESDILSKSNNTPFVGERFQGRVRGTVLGGKVHWLGKENIG